MKPGVGGEAQPTRQLPTGTVTFLFTDVVGSTSAWLRNPIAMHAALSAMMS